MKPFLRSPLVLFFLIVLAGSAPVWAARGGGHAGGRTHGGHGFHGHSGHGHHGGHVSFGFGLGFYGGPWYPYGWPYPYPAYAPYYSDAPGYYYSAADSYPAAQYPLASSQPQQPPEAVWYYCAPLKGYYPYVSQCPEAWQHVPTVPPPGSDNRRRLD